MRRTGSLRRRILILTTLTAAAVAVMVAAVTVGVAALILNRQVDDELRTAIAAGVSGGSAFGGPPARRPIELPAPRDRRRNSPETRVDGSTMTRVISPTGVVGGAGSSANGLDNPLVTVPVDDEDLAVAAGVSRENRGSVEIDDRHYRTLSVPRVDGSGAVQAFRSTDDIDRSLLVLGVVAASVAAAGVVVAAGAGWFVARSALRPVDAMATAAQHVAVTDDLTTRVPEDGGVELAGLARSMNTMLASLAASQLQQQHLIADAGHELRTPISSIRTNLEVLAAHPEMDDADRRAIFADVTAQLEEFGVLIADVTALARGDDASLMERTTVRLDVVVQRAVDRARRRSHGIAINVATEPATLEGQSALLERAVLNVLDNSLKWSPPEGAISVSQTAGVIVIDDLGPGIEPEDRRRVFDRFWRPDSSRSVPGSGLGLAIVAQVVHAHAGTARVESSPGGGTRMVIDLPVDPPDLS